MHRLLCLLALVLGSGTALAQRSYIFVWAGAAPAPGSDFLGVIDADPRSSSYGRIVASIPTGSEGTHPHHTEAEMPANQHLLANGFGAGRTWLFDLRRPRRPRILAEFGDLGGFSHPHTFVRLANGNVLATFQYSSGGASPSRTHRHGAAANPETTASMPAQVTGGLVEMNERGRVIRSASAADTHIADTHIYPYSVLPISQLDRALSTTTDMDDKNTSATAQWVQLWRLSDLKLLRSVALPPGPRGDEHKFSGEPRLLPDGRRVLIHTFNCGLYLVQGLESDQPAARFVYGFEGSDCGVPVLAGHYWLQTVPAAHALVALDVADPEHPREVSRVDVGVDEKPHWIAIDTAGRRVVLNSSGNGEGNRMFIINLDPASGKLSLDGSFRDPGSDRPGISLTGKRWPHGFTGKAIPHGTVFSR